MLDLSIAEVPLDWDSFRRLLRDFWSSYKTRLGKLRLPAASAPSARPWAITMIASIATGLASSTYLASGSSWSSLTSSGGSSVILSSSRKPTSTLFGYITARNLGYAGIESKQTIARGHGGCAVAAHLKLANNPIPSTQGYFSRDDRDCGL